MLEIHAFSRINDLIFTKSRFKDLATFNTKKIAQIEKRALKCLKSSRKKVRETPIL